MPTIPEAGIRNADDPRPTQDEIQLLPLSEKQGEGPPVAQSRPRRPYFERMRANPYAANLRVSRGFRARARENPRARTARANFRAPRQTRQTDGRDRPTSRLAPSSGPDSQERPVSPETLGGETLVQGCAAKRYGPWLRPP